MSFAVKPKTPSISVSPSDAYVASGTSVTLTCTTASSSARISYKFRQGAAEVATRSTNSLTISSVAIAQSGTYSCVVQISGVNSAASTGHSMTVVGKF